MSDTPPPQDDIGGKKGADFDLVPYYTVAMRLQEEVNTLVKERDELKDKCKRLGGIAEESAEDVNDLKYKLQVMEMDKHMATVELRHEKEKCGPRPSSSLLLCWDCVS